MAKEYTPGVKRDETIPPLPSTEKDDLSASMAAPGDATKKSDGAVEDRLEAEEDEFQDEMKKEGDENDTEEGTKAA